MADPERSRVLAECEKCEHNVGLSLFSITLSYRISWLVGLVSAYLRSHGIFWSCVVVFGAVNPWLHLTISLSSEQSNIISIFMFLFLPLLLLWRSNNSTGDGKVALYKWPWCSSWEPPAFLTILLPNSCKDEPS